MFALETSKGCPRKMSIVPREAIDWFLSTTSLQASISDSSAREAIQIDHCVCGNTVLGRITRQRNIFYPLS